MQNSEERDLAAKTYVNEMLAAAASQDVGDFPEFDDSTEVHSILSKLIEVKAKGFRGVVLTALVGIFLDKDYDPLRNFYGCNPRPVFENGIWYALHENGVPCGKSDPLNVAKNVSQLDESWATGKRPESAAKAVVEFLKLVMESESRYQSRLVEYFFFRLLQYGQSISNYQLVEVEASSSSRKELASQIISFSLAFPESGKLPQALVSLLLEGVFRNSDIEVCGGDESVFSTNTTSKKPADVWLEVNGMETNLYEVTLKKVSIKRLDDCLDSLGSTGHLEIPISFVCRVPEDVTDLKIINGGFQYKGKHFNLVDYQSFCSSLVALLPEEELNAVIDSLKEFVQDMQISIKTKEGWNAFFGSSE